MDDKEAKNATVTLPLKFSIQASASTAFTAQGDLVVNAPKIQASAVTFDRLKPEDPINNLVGRIAAEWAYLEHILDQIIWRLIGMDDATGACLTAQFIGIAPRIWTIIALCENKKIDKSKISEIKTFGESLFEPQQLRNRILHDSWWRSSGSKEYFQFKAKPKGELSFGMKPISEETLLQTLNKISKKIEKVLEFNKFFSSLPRT